MGRDFSQSTQASIPTRTVSDPDFRGRISWTCDGVDDYMIDAGSGAVGNYLADATSGWKAHTLFFAISRPAVANTTQTIMYSAGTGVSYRIQTTQNSGGGILVQVYGDNGTTTRYVECPMFVTSSDRFYLCIRNFGTGGSVELEVMVNSRQSTSVLPDGDSFVTDLTGMNLNGQTDLFRHPTSGNYMAGKFADMFFYGAALTDAEVDGEFAWLEGEYGHVTADGWGFNEASDPDFASRVQITSDTNLDLPNGDWTLAFWYRIPDNSGSSYKYFASRNWGASNNKFRFNNYEGTSSKLEAQFVDGSGNSVLFSESGYGGSSAWQHVAVIRDGNDFKLYLDGSQVGSTITDASFGTLNPSADMFLACRNDTYTANPTNRYFGGVMRDWAKWDRVLTSTEIAALVAETKTPDEIFVTDVATDGPAWYIAMDPSKARSQTEPEIGGLTIANSHVHGVYI